MNPLTPPESNPTSYPEPYRAKNYRRWNRRLGDNPGLTNFGVNLTRIEPGAQSSSRHWHSLQDEFVYVLQGEVVLETNAGEEILRAGFPAGTRDGRRCLNRNNTDAFLLVIGDRTPEDEIGYPDIDMQGRLGANSQYHFTRKDGSPVE